MAVQWLSHQTGLVVLAGCSGGLEKEGRGRKIKERREEEWDMWISGYVLGGGSEEQQIRRENNRGGEKGKRTTSWICGIKPEYL